MCCSARLPVRVSSAQQTGVLRAVLEGKWPGVFSVPPPNALISQHGGPIDRRKTCPQRAPPAPHVPCSLSPVPVMPGPRGWMPMLAPAPPHTDPLGEACRAVSAVPRWLPWAHTGVTQACVEHGPLTTGHFEPGAGKKEPVFLELLLVPCPPGAAPEPACQQSPLFICAARGAWGGPPRSPFIQEKRAREARPACPCACGQGSGLHSPFPKGYFRIA